MIIKRLLIRNFGKIHNKTMELSPGINVLYGENESGKTTVHTFLKSMLYGIQRLRGRAAKTDIYSSYEPWENPVVYGGTVWFENAGKQFRLTRNFHKADISSELLCEDDGEVLDVEAGDLDAVLGGVSEAVYENTVSVAQLKSVTGPDLVREVQNYMASYQGTGDSSVNLDRAMQMLKMSRKGYLVQVERSKKENEKEQEKIAAKIGYLRQELDDLDDKRSQVSLKEEALHIKGDENGEVLLDDRIAQVRTRQGTLWGIMLLTVILTIGGIALGQWVLPGNLIVKVIVGIVGVIVLILELKAQKKLAIELNKRRRMKERWLSRQEKLQWDIDNLEEMRKEKEIALRNMTAEYRDAQENAYLPMAEGTEIEALNLAMATIEALSGNIHSQVAIRLRRRTSRILSEITGGKYQEVLIDAQFHMSVNTQDRVVPLENLSRGTIEQIYFALRMAVGELLCGQERFPVILDDVFGMYDEDRLTAVLRWLSKEKRQIIISTCHKREMEILDREGISYQKILL